MTGAFLSPDVLPEPLFRKTLDLLVEMTALSSQSNDPAGLRRMAQRLATELSLRGMSSEIRDEVGEEGAKLPVLLGRGKDLSGGPLLLIGHIDTVLPAATPEIREDLGEIEAAAQGHVPRLIRREDVADDRRRGWSFVTCG